MRKRLNYAETWNEASNENISRNYAKITGLLTHQQNTSVFH